MQELGKTWFRNDYTVHVSQLLTTTVHALYRTYLTMQQFHHDNSVVIVPIDGSTATTSSSLMAGVQMNLHKWWPLNIHIHFLIYAAPLVHHAVYL